jgi:ATP phosphoribosyltransferase regulatory subunit
LAESGCVLGSQLLKRTCKLKDFVVTQKDRPKNRERDQERLETVLTHFLGAGFARREPALLQPAGAFLDRLGEDFRGRLYLTNDGGDAELCLRPEYTIPVSLDYLASPDAGRTAALAYGGAIFRVGEGQLSQAGLESFGREDREAADAEILGVALDAAKAAGAARLHVRLGDAGLVKAFLDRLSLPSAWRRRFEIGFARGTPLSKIFAPPARKNGEAGAGMLAALSNVDAAGAKKLVEDLLSIAGISTVGGRSAGEIAERFLEQAALADGAGVNFDKRALIEAFFEIEAAPDAASATLRKLAQDARLDLGFALDSFDTRSSFIAARGLSLEDMVFSTSFPHSIDYYSGFMFEARVAGASGASPAISGGRYDTLLKTLGAARDIPAVGAAISIDRLLGGAA